jgi:7-cyano-7-deazaguanine synthase
VKGEQAGRPAIVLLSGGLDSATTLGLALRQGYSCHALTVDYGQKHAAELDCAARVAEALGATSHRVARVELGGIAGSSLTDAAMAVAKDRTAAEIGSGIPETYVPARNTLLLSLALGYGEVLGALDLFIGVNAVDYSGYPDCRPEFLSAFEELARLATRAGAQGGRFRVHAPLMNWSKGRIVRAAMDVGLDPALTLSCYDPKPGGLPCGRCDACILRARGFADAGLIDEAVVKD